MSILPNLILGTCTSDTGIGGVLGAAGAPRPPRPPACPWPGGPPRPAGGPCWGGAVWAAVTAAASVMPATKTADWRNVLRVLPIFRVLSSFAHSEITVYQ